MDRHNRFSIETILGERGETVGSSSVEKTKHKIRSKRKEVVWEWVKTGLWAAVIAWFMINFVVQSFFIPTSSMEPTIIPGQRILAAKFWYRFTDPQRGDIIVFREPAERSQGRARERLVKRVVGLPGERVRIENGQILINDQPLNEEFSERVYLAVGYYGSREVIVPEGTYYVLGDNSINSLDSRIWGFVPRNTILGRGFFTFWPLTRLGLLR
ncbi:MAG TPA: signal peptidase I [Atribacteraceae bacterium]|nr:signal peptidase I [Atribacteraceae bacterium]